MVCLSLKAKNSNETLIERRSDTSSTESRSSAKTSKVMKSYDGCFDGKNCEAEHICHLSVRKTTVVKSNGWTLDWWWQYEIEINANYNFKINLTVASRFEISDIGKFLRKPKHFKQWTSSSVLDYCKKGFFLNTRISLTDNPIS